MAPNRPRSAKSDCGSTMLSFAASFAFICGSIRRPKMPKTRVSADKLCPHSQHGSNRRRQARVKAFGRPRVALCGVGNFPPLSDKFREPIKKRSLTGEDFLVRETQIEPFRAVDF
jgi:hypothetical protein